MKNSRNQYGFTIVEISVVLLVILALAASGYYIVRHKDKEHSLDRISTVGKETNAASGSSSQSKTDLYEGWQTHEEPRFTLKFPSDWKFIKAGEEVSVDGVQQESVEDQFVAPGENSNDGKTSISMTQDENALSLTAKEWAKQNPLAQGEISDQKSFKINGYDAYSEVVSLGNAPKTTRLVVAHGQMVVLFNYAAISKYTDTYGLIIKSIHFTK